MNPRPDPRALIAFEREIRYQEAPAPASAGICLRVGSQPLLFSAPHAAQHKRCGSWKQEDEYTAAIAEFLHRRTAAHALYLTHQIDPDPHDDGDDNLYKRTLAAFVQRHSLRLIVDLHGSRGDRDFGVALGTIRGTSCPGEEALLIEVFEQAGFLREGYECSLDRLAVNPPRYTGGLVQPTITRFACQKLGIPAVQVELNAWLRVLQRHPHSSNAYSRSAPQFHADLGRFQRLMQALEQLVARLGRRADGQTS